MHFEVRLIVPHPRLCPAGGGSRPGSLPLAQKRREGGTRPKTRSDWEALIMCCGGSCALVFQVMVTWPPEVEGLTTCAVKSQI